MLVSKLSCLIVLHLPRIIKVAFVADYNHLNMLIRMAMNLIKPPRNVIEGGTVGDVIDKQSNDCTT
jgi:hypothetical protein